jgi:predicted DNA binding CopG/RHH family protein
MPRGRPPVKPEDRRGEYITVRLSQAELEQIEQAAQKDGKGATTWAREVLLAKVINQGH